MNEAARPVSSDCRSYDAEAQDCFSCTFGGSVIGNDDDGSWAETAVAPDLDGSGVASSSDWEVAAPFGVTLSELYSWCSSSVVGPASRRARDEWCEVGLLERDVLSLVCCWTGLWYCGPATVTSSHFSGGGSVLGMNCGQGGEVQCELVRRSPEAVASAAAKSNSHLLRTREGS